MWKANKGSFPFHLVSFFFCLLWRERGIIISCFSGELVMLQTIWLLQVFIFYFWHIVTGFVHVHTLSLFMLFSCSAFHGGQLLWLHQQPSLLQLWWWGLLCLNSQDQKGRDAPSSLHWEFLGECCFAPGKKNIFARSGEVRSLRKTFSPGISSP